MKDENLANFIAGCLRAGQGSTASITEEFGMARILNSLAQVASDEIICSALAQNIETAENWRKTQLLLHQAAAIWAPERKKEPIDPLHEECMTRFLKRLPLHHLNGLGQPPKLRVSTSPGIVSCSYAKESNGRYEPGDATYLPVLFLGSTCFEHCSSIFASYPTYLEAARGLFVGLCFEFPGGNIPCGLAVPED